MEFDEFQWDSYTKANQLFCDTIVKHFHEGDVIWIHDYQLMLLPHMLRKALGQHVKIGFFLHTPFPSSEVFGYSGKLFFGRLLPVRKEICEGLLASNLVGLQTYDYSRHFLNSCIKFVDVEHTMNGLKHKTGLVCNVCTFPIGIEPEKFQKVQIFCLASLRLS